MPQVNFYVGSKEPLKARLDAGAERLGVAPSALAKRVVDEFLDTYVAIVGEAEDHKERSFSELRQLLSERRAVLGDRRFEASRPASEHLETRALERKPSARVRAVRTRGARASA